MEQTLGVKPGSVSVFGLLNDKSKKVEVAIEEGLLNEPEIGFHPNVNTATFLIPGSSLVQIINFTGHKYNTVKV